jgi:hypothetical protein
MVLSAVPEEEEVETWDDKEAPNLRKTKDPPVRKSRGRKRSKQCGKNNLDQLDSEFAKVYEREAELESVRDYNKVKTCRRANRLLFVRLKSAPVQEQSLTVKTKGEQPIPFTKSPSDESLPGPVEEVLPPKEEFIFMGEGFASKEHLEEMEKKRKLLLGREDVAAEPKSAKPTRLCTIS